MSKAIAIRPDEEDWLAELLRAYHDQVLAQGAVDAISAARRPAVGTADGRPLPDIVRRSVRLGTDRLGDAPKGVEIAEFGDDGPTPARLAKGDVALGDHRINHRETVRGYRAAVADPLLLYWKRKDISAAEFKAGLRLRTSFRIAAIAKRITPRYAEPISGKTEISDAQAEARHDYVVAMRAVGPILAPILAHVVCFDQVASDWSKNRGAVAKGRAGVEGLVTLRLALDALERHYRLR
jgi:hypothetical protein